MMTHRVYVFGHSSGGKRAESACIVLFSVKQAYSRNGTLFERFRRIQ